MSIKAKRKNKPKVFHVHLFKITRGMFDSKSNLVSALDMECECGFKVFIDGNFYYHRGDMPNIPLKFKDLE